MRSLPRPLLDRACAIRVEQANRAFNAVLREAEKNEMERANGCAASQVLLRKFQDSRASCTRAESLIRMGRENDAEKHALEALRASRGLEPGENGRCLATTALRQLVTSYAAQYRFVDAEPYARELVDRQSASLGALHPGTVEPMSALASIVASNGRFREAVDLLQQVASKCTHIYGAAHPATRQARKRLEQALATDTEQGKLQCAIAFRDNVWLDRFFEQDRVRFTA